MASKLTIFNRALQKIGSQPLSSTTENAPRAVACNTAYDAVRISELRSRIWNFAIKRVILAPDADAPIFTKTAAFSLPEDFLRLLDPDPEDNANFLDWQIEGKKIVTSTSATSFNLRYIADITDPNDMDPIFQEVLAAALAIEINEVINQSNTKYQLLVQWYQEILNRARRVNAFETEPVTPADDTWLTVRN